jgi:hypothetical protein
MVAAAPDEFRAFFGGEQDYDGDEVAVAGALEAGGVGE